MSRAALCMTIKAYLELGMAQAADVLRLGIT